MKILFLIWRDIFTASSRYRVYQYLDELKLKGFQYQIKFLPKKGIVPRIFFVISSIFIAINNDIIFIQKILFPSPIVYILKFLNKNIIFDWDDALYAEPPFGKQSKKEIAKRQYKLRIILKICKLTIVGNHHLKKYALNFNKNIVIIPTSIITSSYKLKKNYDSSPLIIGWIGSSGNLGYLKKLDEVFETISKKYKDKVVLKVVCDKPFYSRSGINIINKKWTLSDEIPNIITFDIGIMPLNKDEWSKGKCAFKALQYMACGVPCIASPIGANMKVIKNRINGYLVSTPDEWVEKLSILIENRNLREIYGKNGRKIVDKEYSAKISLHKIINAFVIVTCGK
ncbi:hypothetical protein LCGC14_1197610 [marine sediment metagenome]|uniref:Glycosyl transferase family 1 domain-containing protein n=1 Tax=marine sediment metagenome TaxID=412755 RepID=A0A0F9P094_9ZZZZ|nr:glycosyltransferase [Candidatus Aminicenantes bacterium]